MKLFNRDDSSRATEGFEEAYAFPEKIFRIFGISNAKREFNIRNLFASLYKWFHLLDPLLFLVFAFNSIENFGDMNRTFEAMCGSSAAINGGVKLLTYYVHGSEIGKLKRMAVDDLQKYMNNDSLLGNKNAVKYLRIINMINKYITIIYAICGIAFISLPFLSYILDLPRSDWMQPVTLCVFFTNHRAHPGYEFNFVLSAWSANFLCMILAACDLTFVLLCFYAFVQLIVCKNECRKIGDVATKRSAHQQYVHLCECVILYTKIATFLKDVTRIFVWSIFMQCVLSVLIITSTISYIKYSFLNSYGLLGSNLTELFAYCWIGQIISNMSNDVNESLYSSNWQPFLKQRQTSQAFLFFLRQTQTPNELWAFGLVQLSFSTLMKVVRATFSYIAFLENVTN